MAELASIERERRERLLIDEARRIAAGESDQAPSVEHLIAVLAALDGTPPEPSRETWDGCGVPF